MFFPFLSLYNAPMERLLDTCIVAYFKKCEQQMGQRCHLSRRGGIKYSLKPNRCYGETTWKGHRNLNGATDERKKRQDN